MKKLLSIMLIATAMMTFVACGNKANEEGNTPTATPTVQPTVQPTEEPTQEPEQDVAGEEVVEPTQAPIQDATLESVYTAVKEVYGEDYLPNMRLDAETVTSTFGLNTDLYEEVVAEVPMISFNVDTFVAVKAKEGKAEEVKKVLEDYRNSLVESSMQYPVNVPKIQASRVDVYGDYVFYTMLGVVPMEVQEQGDEAILKAAEENNQKAIDVIEGIVK